MATAHFPLSQGSHNTSPLVQWESPKEPLSEGSSSLTAGNKSFQDWTNEEHRACYQQMQRIVQSLQGETVLVYGSSGLSTAFRWQIIPYSNTNWLMSKVEEVAIGYKILTAREEPIEEWVSKSDAVLLESSQLPVTIKSDGGVQGDDLFCKAEIIQLQRVFEGRDIDILYDRSPVGFGDHKIHFLLIPKKHKRDFRDLSEEEHLEVMELAKFVLKRLKKDSELYRVYMYHKAGRIQSVKHFHLHLVATVDAEHDKEVKSQMIWNFIKPSFKLEEAELREKVTHYRILFSDE